MTDDAALAGRAQWLRIYIGESDHWHGRPLYQQIVQMLRAAGLAGATVLRGVEGFGAHSRIHTARILRMSEDLPMVIDVIDSAERIAAVLPRVQEMVDGGLVTLMEVSILAQRPHRDKPAG